MHRQRPRDEHTPPLNRTVLPSQICKNSPWSPRTLQVKSARQEEVLIGTCVLSFRQAQSLLALPSARPFQGHQPFPVFSLASVCTSLLAPYTGCTGPSQHPLNPAKKRKSVGQAIMEFVGKFVLENEKLHMLHPSRMSPSSSTPVFLSLSLSL